MLLYLFFAHESILSPYLEFFLNLTSSCFVPFNIDASEKEEKEDAPTLYEMPDGQILKVWGGTLKRVVWYFEECGVVF